MQANPDAYKHPGKRRSQPYQVVWQKAVWLSALLNFTAGVGPKAPGTVE
jgi:hypothetical protein